MLFCVAYPFFILQRSLGEYQGQRSKPVRGQLRALTVWSAGSFAGGGEISTYKKIKKLK